MIIEAALGGLVGYGLMFALARYAERITFGKDNMPREKTPAAMLKGVIAERRRGQI
jgi:hypothetical protein